MDNSDTSVARGRGQTCGQTAARLCGMATGARRGGNWLEREFLVINYTARVEHVYTCSGSES